MKLLYYIYQLIVVLPIALVLTILTALTTIIGSLLGSKSFWGYYPGMLWSRAICLVCLLPVKVYGRENIQKGQSYVIIPNHQSILDTFLIYGFIGIRFKWMIKKEILKVPFVGFACKMCGHIFIDRTSRKDAAGGMTAARKALVNGMSVTIFPEGTRTKDGTLGRFKKGAFSLAEELHLPLLPVTINGAYNVLPKGRWYLQCHRMSITIHKPIQPKGLPEDDAQIRNGHMVASIEESAAAIGSALKN
ncbi:MAG: 1-acyl-sn-glycerol-3-phosphate acyltransferase [Bacteroidaceae bacterium]|nr:1-acyl-sn-glycerol-3-phosphate acyltransferase [Bacteroidaceae bacterium]